MNQTQRCSDAANVQRDDVDLLREFGAAATRAHDASAFDWLTKRLCLSENLMWGIRPEYDPGHPWRVHSALLGVGRIEAQGQFWQPQEDGKAAIIVPVSASYHPVSFAPVDLIAFHPVEPERWYFRRGVGDVLGEEAISRAMFTGRPVCVRDDPLTWLQAGATDVVILDWSACLPLYLSDATGILATSPRTAERIRAGFDGYGRCPEIRIMGARRAG